MRISPWLSVADATRAVAFYKAGLGADELSRVEAGPGRIAIAELALGEATFWVAEDPTAAPRGGPAVRMIVTVDDPDALFARAVAAGAAVVAPIHVAHGWRVGRVVDPAGHHWELGRRL
jgi:PhnB protein